MQRTKFEICLYTEHPTSEFHCENKRFRDVARAKNGTDLFIFSNQAIQPKINLKGYTYFQDVLWER
jgi:hypothetical protein